jgi:MFS family permease
VRGATSRYSGGVATTEVSGPTAFAVTPNRLSLGRLTLLSLYWVAIGYLWNSIGAQVLPPIIRGFVGQAHQGTALSILESTGTLIAVFWQPVIGALSDRTTIAWGRRRPYIAGGAVGSAVFLVLMAFVGSYFWLFAVYFLLQLASNTAQGPYQGLLPDVVPDADLGKAGAFYGLGNLLGTLVGFVVVGIFTSHGRYDLAFYSMAAMLLVTMVLTVTLVPDDARPAPGLTMHLAEVTVGTFRLSPRRYGNFLWLMGSRLLILMGIVGLETFANFFFKDVFYPGSSTHATDQANAATTYLLAVIVVLALLVSYPAARLSDRVGRKPLVVACAALGGAGTLGLVFAHFTLVPAAVTAPLASLLDVPRGLAQVLCCGVLIGVATGSFLSVDWAFTIDVIPRDEAGRFLGFSNIATAGAGIIARFIAGPLLDHFNAGAHILGILGGYPVVFGMFVVFFIAGGFLVLPVREATRQMSS